MGASLGRRRNGVNLTNDGILPSGKLSTFGCRWTAKKASASMQAIQDRIEKDRTIKSRAMNGILVDGDLQGTPSILNGSDEIVPW